MSNLVDFLNRFQAFETQERLFTRKIRGFAYWDYIRHFLYEDLVGEKGLRPNYTPIAGAQKKSFIKLALKEAKNGIRELGRYFIFCLRRKKYDFVLFEAPNKRLIDGKWVDPVNYPFVKCLRGEYRILVLDEGRYAEYDSRLYPVDSVCIRWAYALSRFAVRFLRISAEEDGEIALINAKLSQAFDSQIDIRPYLKAHYFYQIIFARLLKKILAKTGARGLFFQSNFRRYYAEAARLSGLKVTELQHGATNFLDLNTSYNPSEDQPISTVPDYILTFGEYWNHQFRSRAHKKAIGLPFFDQKMDELKSQAIVRDPKKILGISVMDPSLLEAFYETARSLPEFTFYYKLRREEYPHLAKIVPSHMREQRNMVFIDNDSKPIYDYLNECGYAVSTCSTALFEGLYLGCQPIIYTGFYYEMMQDLIDEGYSFVAGSAREMEQILKAGSRSANRPDPEYFYRRSDPKNTRDTVEGILK